ncbi:hypothetical protein HYDPIDRAFT_115289 [Hydnomerulius pinastri MD-312]|uniref:Uncharacterized protein n=1 Tax=Hydnomerulius pinastri MD-312 TaxID=994086 RepID=A0A0C9WC70_9AGAM|nr:hypothetical protein HYDPIDRAFT_115289 [Hydnomerulius pinastri MD-312]
MFLPGFSALHSAPSMPVAPPPHSMPFPFPPRAPPRSRTHSDMRVSPRNTSAQKPDTG